MSRTESHLGAAQRHGRRAIAELRHMTADSALYWVLAHRGRVAQFRRAIEGTPAAEPFGRLLKAIRIEASELPRPAPRRKPARPRQRRAARPFMQPFLIG